jgi:hypothetical protein
MTFSFSGLDQFAGPNDRLGLMYVALHNNQVIFSALQHREPTSLVFRAFWITPGAAEKSGRPRPIGGGPGELANTAGMSREFLQAGHRRVETRLELRNVAANYPFESSHRFPEIQPNSGHRDYSRVSCDVAETQLRARGSISAPPSIFSLDILLIFTCESSQP